MAVETLPKIEVATLSIRVPAELRDRFNEAARIISEITPKKPVDAEDLISFCLFKESTGSVVIEFLEFVQNCDQSVTSENGPGRTEPALHQRSNGR